jgi:membrane protein DedA with SNARE-associated domain
MRMPADRFWLANVSSAVVWAPVLMLVGNHIGRWGKTLIGEENLAAAILGGIIACVLCGAVWAAVRARR